MPNITELRSPVSLVPEPTDRGADTAREAGMVENRFARETGEAIGAGVSRLGGQIGREIDQFSTAQSISHGAATYSSLYDGLTSQWNQLAAKTDPNDTSIKKGFEDNVLGPAQDKFLKAFDGASPEAQKWAQQRVAEMRQHFMEKTTADMGIRAGQAVQNNLSTMEQNYSNTVMNDPTALPHVLTSIKTDVDAMVKANPYLTASDAAQVQSELVPKLTKNIAKSAFYGMAKNNPEGAKQALAKGDFNDYMDAGEQIRAGKFADEVQKANEHDAKQQKLDAEKQFKEGSADKSETIRASMYDVNTGRIKPVSPQLNQQIVTDPTLTPHDRTELIRWNQQQYGAQIREDKVASEGGAVRDDPKTLADLRKRVGDDDNPTTRQEIGDVLAAGHITSKSAHDLAWRVGRDDAAWAAVQRPFKQQFDNIKHTALSSPTSIVKYLPPEEQQARLNQVEADAQQILRDARARKEDMRPYLDPNSPKWALKDALHQITASPAAAVAGQADRVRAGEKVDAAAEAITARKAIEGGADPVKVRERYKARTGKDLGAATVQEMTGVRG